MVYGSFLSCLAALGSLYIVYLAYQFELLIFNQYRPCTHIQPELDSMNQAQTRAHDRLIAIGLLTVAMALWSSAFVAMKQALTTVSIADVMFYRLALASLAILPFVISRPQRWPVKRDLLLLALLGILEPVLYFVFESLALQNTTATQGGLVFALLPLAILAMTALTRRRLPTGRLLIAGLIGAAAVLAATLGQSTQSSTAPAPALGNSLELLAVLSAAAFTVLADRLLTYYSPELLTFFQCLFGTTCFGLYWLATGSDGGLSGPAFGYVLYLGLVVTGGAYFAFNNAIQKLSGQVVGPFYAAVPTFALISSVIWTGEALTPAIGLGIVLSATAIVVATAR